MQEKQKVWVVHQELRDSDVINENEIKVFSNEEKALKEFEERKGNWLNQINDDLQDLEPEEREKCIEKSTYQDGKYIYEYYDNERDYGTNLYIFEEEVY